MEKEQELMKLMQQLWDSMVDANEKLNTFINAGMPSTIEKRHKPFIRRWDDIKGRVETFYDFVEKLTEDQLEPVEVKLPWQSETFGKEWQNWKDYLAEQHHRHMKSRMEYAALSHLKKLSDGKETVAIEYLQFAMAGGYPRFFKVTPKNYEQPTATAGGRGDGDF